MWSTNSFLLYHKINLIIFAQIKGNLLSFSRAKKYKYHKSNKNNGLMFKENKNPWKDNSLLVPGPILK